MSRQRRPSPSSAGTPSAQRGEDLDGLQDDPVGERRARADAVGGEHDQAGGLEDAHVRRGGGQHRADVDRQQHRGGGRQAWPGLQAEREHHHVAGEPLQRPREQLGGDRGDPVARAWRTRRRPCRARRSSRASASRGARDALASASAAPQRSSRGPNDHEQRRSPAAPRAPSSTPARLAVQQRHAGERDRRAGSPARAG